jgi:Domain of unknown function (DUF4190)
MSGPQAGDPWFGTVDADPPASRRTNTLAIASLVLGVVWCGGIGSVLAVIFSVQARRSIRDSDGTESGEGLATAGLVLGIVGIVGAVLTTLLVVVVAVTANNVAQDAIQRFSHGRVEVPAGRSVNVTTSDFSTVSGVKTVTIFAVIQPVPAQSESDVPEAGKEFAVADIRVCAGSAGSQEGPSGSLFDLVFSGGDRVNPSVTAVAKQPNLLDVRGMGSKQCLRGYITFEIATGTRPTAVTYEPDPLRTYEWKLPSR